MAEQVGNPERPGRSGMPDGHSIAEYWLGQGRFGPIVLDHPACFTCARPAERWSQLERAHLVDRACGGLDHQANLVLLCWPCHRCMPSFDASDGASALAWVHGMRRVGYDNGGLEIVYEAVLDDVDPPAFRGANEPLTHLVDIRP